MITPFGQRRDPERFLEPVLRRRDSWIPTRSWFSGPERNEDQERRRYEAERARAAKNIHAAATRERSWWRKLK
jgi:hypothetical protein